MFRGRADIVATDQSNALMLYLNSTRPERAGQRLSLSSFWDMVAGMATLLPLQLQSKRKHMEFAWHHFVMAAFLGKLVKRWLVQASPQKQYHVQSGLLTEFVVWKSISVLQYSPAEIRRCGLGGTTSFWVLEFLLSVMSPSFPSRVTVGLMEFLQSSKCHHSSVIFLSVSCCCKGASHLNKNE